MSPVQSAVHQPRWYLIPARVLLVTFLLTALSFAISLLLTVGVIVLVTIVSMEIRHYRQAKVLADIERAS
jgi:hypothetical protein